MMSWIKHKRRPDLPSCPVCGRSPTHWSVVIEADCYSGPENRIPALVCGHGIDSRAGFEHADLRVFGKKTTDLSKKPIPVAELRWRKLCSLGLALAGKGAE